MTPEYKKLGEAVAASPKLKDRVVIAKVSPWRPSLSANEDVKALARIAKECKGQQIRNSQMCRSVCSSLSRNLQARQAILIRQAIPILPGACQLM